MQDESAAPGQQHVPMTKCYAEGTARSPKPDDLRLAPFVDPDRTMIKLKKILVPVDFSASSEEALDLALDLAVRLAGEVHVLHVLEYPVYMVPDLTVTVAGSPSQAYVTYARKQAAQLMHDLLEPYKESSIRFTNEIVPGEPEHKILSSAVEGGFDLIVMGTHGRKGLKHLLLGSVAEWVVRNAPCPVLTTRERET